MSFPTRLILFLLTAALSITLSAQPDNALAGTDIPVPPTAAGLGEYGDIPVGYFTGVPNISIPITTVQEGPLSLPISLSYHSAGVRTGESASWVGLGWSLNAGGVITRGVRGRPDDMNYGWYHYADQTDWRDELTWPHVLSGAQDTEPDIYTFNVGGYSGKFFFDEDQEAHFVPQRDVKLEVTTDGNGFFKTLTLITPDGTQYVFGSESGEATNSGRDFTYVNFSDFTFEFYPTSWYLTRIVSYDGLHDINLEYVAEGYEMKSLADCRQIISPYENCITCFGNTEDNFTNEYQDNTEIRGTRLDKITASTYSVEFNADTTREDLDYPVLSLPEPKRLDNIEIDEGSYCTRFELSYDYFQTTNPQAAEDKRLQLLGVREVACDNSLEKGAYSFDYHGPTQSGKNILPSRLTRNFDHWGYYNGANNSDALNIPEIRILDTDGVTTSTIGGSDREPDAAYAEHGVLSKITYPTGGYTEFSYEGNTYYGPQTTTSRNIIQSTLQTCYSPTSTSCCGTRQDDSGTISFTQDEIDNGEWRLKLISTAYDGGCFGYTYDVQTWLDVIRLNSGGTTTLVGQVAINMQSTTDEEEIFGPVADLGSMIALVAGQDYRLELNSVSGKAEFEIYQYVDTTTSQNNSVGGLRIAEIRTHDGESSANDIVKTFTYEDAQTPSASSGVLFDEPIYGLALTDDAIYNYPTGDPRQVFENGWTKLDGAYDAANDGDLGLFQSRAINPLADYSGYTITYKHVVEDLNGNGKNEYYYSHESPTPPSGYLAYPFAPVEATVKTGHLLKREAKTASGTVVSSSQITGTAVNPYEVLDTTNHVYRVTSIPIIKSNPMANYSRTFGTVYQPRTGVYQVTQRKETMDGVETVTNTTYGDFRHYMPTEVSVENSDGKDYVQKMKYAFDFMDDEPSYVAWAEMVDRNIIATPIETTTEVDGTPVAGRRTKYGFFTSSGYYTTSNTGGRIYPREIYNYEMTWSGGSVVKSGTDGWIKRLTFDRYHGTTGFPWRLTNTGWDQEVLTWNANGLLATRTFKNFTWSYAYHTDTRLLSSITDIDGQVVNFTYDALKRPATRSERGGNVVTSWTYQYQDGSNPRNYQKTSTSYTSVTGSSLTQTDTWQYLDGLGRPLQTVRQAHSPDQKDVIAAVEYDQYGRVVKQYEPFEASVGTGAYAAVPGGTDYTLTTYEASPLNRPDSVTPPDWYASTMAYGKNVATVTVPGSGTSYSASTLYEKTVTDPEGNQTITYTDRRGRTILTRRSDGSNTNDTYYEYDGKDRPETVVPPGASLSTAGLIYTYTYDGRDNVLTKQLPDQDDEHEFLYDDRGLLTYSRDPRQTAAGEWLHNRYDDYGRMIKSGIINNSGTPSASDSTGFATLHLTSAYDGTTTIETGKLIESRTRILGTADWLEIDYSYDTYGRVDTTYGNNHLDLTAGSETVSTTYDFADNPLTVERMSDTPYATKTVRDRMTYDHAGRLKNTYLKIDSGTEKLLSEQNYTIEDELAEKNLGYVSGSNWLQSVDYTYNAQGWLTQINQPSLGGATAAFPICDTGGGGGGEEPPPGGGGGPGGELFQSPGGKPAVAAKSMSGTDSYDLFYLELCYDNPLSGFGSDAPARQDGNISQAIWRVRGHERMTYGYTYDYLSRLTDAHTGTIDESDVLSPENWFNTQYEYDARGNLTDLGRSGLVRDGSCWKSDGIFDNLLYYYYPGTNRVRRIRDFGGTAHGFDENGATLSDIFRYDENGNMIEDPYKNIDIDYNYLNLPELVTKGSDTLEIHYAADGSKLQQVRKSGSTVELTRDYLGGIEYVNDTLDAIYHSEGRLFYGGASTPEYEYRIQDHLGNTRITFSDLDDDGFIEETAGELLQENHYYPFGMQIDGPWATPAAGAEERYRYNGKELVEDAGLDWYAYGARYYDAAIAKFPSIDRFAGKFAYQSPYVYAANNPIKFIDVNGDSIIVTDELRHSGTYKSFLLWSGSEEGQEFYSKYDVGGKYEHINITFGLSSKRSSGYTNVYAVDLEGNRKKLTATETIKRYKLSGKDSNIESGESLEFDVFVSPLEYTRRAEGLSVLEPLVNTAETFLHESQHVEIMTRDISSDRELNIGVYNQHYLMKQESGEWFKKRSGFYHRYRPELTNTQVRDIVNGFIMQ